jgi:hypothetical protein
VLKATLMVFCVLPLLIFATDATSGRAAKAARAEVARRSGARPESDSTRRERVRRGRANIHPDVGSIVSGLSLQLFWVAVVAVIGRRIFGLRL